MRKKDLLAQNTALFEKLQQAELCIRKLRTELEQKDLQIASLQNEAEDDVDIKIDGTVFEPKKIADLSEQAVENGGVRLNEITEYGADIIGKLVVSSARYSNRLTSGGNTDYRELVNLLLGKTEVTKSEILSVTVGNGTADEKKSAIDEIYERTEEYFISVMAQIND